MGVVEVLDPVQLVQAGGWKVDVSRGGRNGRVSSKWFNRPDDERYLSLDDLWASVKGRSERSRSRVVATADIRVEAALSTRLIERSTRALRLTAEGEVLHARALRILAEVEAAESILTAQTSIPQGVLRISAPVLFGQTFLGQIAAEFVKLYPQARLDIMLSDRRVDLMEDNIEAAIRIGEQPDSSLILRTFAEVDHILVAGPDLAAGAAVQRPDDLADRPCIAHAVDAHVNRRAKLTPHRRPILTPR